MTRRILGIETSCDETSAAVLDGFTVLSNITASQYAVHAPYGGVVPELASRRHVEALDAIVDEALHTAGISNPASELDAIAVSARPGLIGALLSGVSWAKGFAYATGLPLIPVDHLAGHCASVLLADDPAELPMLALIASGGHTMIVTVDEDFTITRRGSTRDDAAGEAFDKGARALGLSQPGGPAIEQHAAQAEAAADAEIHPAMVHHESLDMSFSGIKTALLRHIQAHPPDAHALPAVCRAYEDAIIDTLAGAMDKALARHAPTTCAVVGGVANNTRLRTRLDELCTSHNARLVAAPTEYCADNGAMIAAAAQFGTALSPADMAALDATAVSTLVSEGVLAVSG